ncbi:MAG TPA: hypothetical protein VF121_16005 [Thermoanaerobaculia bacterium]|nr:hypothetical protein [Thermoanaerobaculia bacterium]
MKRSLIRCLTALAAVSLLMLALAPAANAAPWGLAVDSGMRSAGWFESALAWLQERFSLSSARPARETKQKVVQNTGCGIDANGAPAVCR